MHHSHSNVTRSIDLIFWFYFGLFGNDLGILPEALRTKCARCSPQQLEGGLRVVTKLYYDYPTQYARLRAKWDPTGEYHRRFEEYLRGLQFNTINNNEVSRKWMFMYYVQLFLLPHHQSHNLWIVLKHWT